MPTHYFCDLTLGLLLFRPKGNNLFLFKETVSRSIFISILRTIPLLKAKFDNLIKEPDVHIGDYKGLYYRINKEAIECTDSVYKKLNLENCQFIRVYNNKFKTNKFIPFIMKWVSIYTLEILKCLYRVHLDKPCEKILYLRDNLLNRNIYEWWEQKTGNKIQVEWQKESELMAALETMFSILVSFIYRLFYRGLCMPVKPKKFKIMKEVAWGLRNLVLRDDFFVDNEKLLGKDVLLYTTDSGHEGRMSAYKDAQNSEYECVNSNKLKIPLDLLLQRLFKYYLLLPAVFTFKNLGSKQNYLLREWLAAFHGVSVNYEILLSHYRLGLELSVNEASLMHIPGTIILNNRGAKSALYHWSDLTSGHFILEDFKSSNIYLVWGKAHLAEKQDFVDSTIETGCWLKHDFSKFTRNKRSIYEKLALPTNVNGYTVLAFYDRSFSPDIYITEEVLLDFWKMMAELIEERKDVIGILKPKSGNEKYDALSDKGREMFTDLKGRCLGSGRFYFIDNPTEIAVTEVIAISDLNITMGMGSPSTIALLCGKVGLYYETTGNDCHPFAKKYKNRVVFENKKNLFSAVDMIINEGHNPLNEIDEELLRSYDQFRDEMGVERFRDTLLASL